MISPHPPGCLAQPFIQLCSALYSAVLCPSQTQGRFARFEFSCNRMLLLLLMMMTLMMVPLPRQSVGQRGMIDGSAPPRRAAFSPSLRTLPQLHVAIESPVGRTPSGSSAPCCRSGWASVGPGRAPAWCHTAAGQSVQSLQHTSRSCSVHKQTHQHRSGQRSAALVCVSDPCGP
jgi:hypothetical protein